MRDRDSDGQPDALCYAWSGISGDPLTVRLNIGMAQAIVAHVQNFNMGCRRLVATFVAGFESARRRGDHRTSAKILLAIASMCQHVESL